MMKAFKKRRTKLPRLGAVPRLIRRKCTAAEARHYRLALAQGEMFPEIMRQVCAPRLDPARRGNIAYYPDLHNFRLNEWPNRSLPVAKFLDLFKGMIDQTVLDTLLHDLTNYRLEFHTTPDEWERVYDDDNVHSCMSQTAIVRTYAHPDNKLALAALYAPGTNTVVARTIVNTEEKWYIRLFGDRLLVDKLQELGYKKLSGYPEPFKMYAFVGDRYRRELQLPYFDFSTHNIVHHPETHDPDTGYIEITVNGDPATNPPRNEGMLAA